MGDKSKIEWTDASWTPVRARHRETGKIGWHCEHVTPGCHHCYSETLNRRLGTGLLFKPGHQKDIEIFLDEKMLTQPLRWRRPRMIFVCSMTDLFADFVPDEWIDRAFAVMALAPQHTFQVLTKRAERMRAYLSDPRTADRIADRCAREVPDGFDLRPSGLMFEVGGRGFNFKRWPLPNVWLGVSAEDQRRADERIPHLLATPAAVRFLSAEPLLGPIDFRQIGGSEEQHPYDSLYDRTETIFGVFGRPRVDWVIVGGDSGPGARPMHPDWARKIRDDCAAAGVAFHFKQWGAHVPGSFSGSTPIVFVRPDGSWGGFRETGTEEMGLVGKHRAGRLLDGRTHDEFPEAHHG